MSSPAPFSVTLHTPQTALITCEPFTVKWDYTPPSRPFNDDMTVTAVLHPGGDERVSVYPLHKRVPASLPGASWEWSPVNVPAGTYHLSIRTYAPPGQPKPFYAKTELFEVKEGDDTSCIGQPLPSDIPTQPSTTLEESSSSSSSGPESTEAQATEESSTTSASASTTPGDDLGTQPVPPPVPIDTLSESESSAAPTNSTSPSGPLFPSTTFPSDPDTTQDPENDSQEGAATRYYAGIIISSILGGATALLGLAIW